MKEAYYHHSEEEKNKLWDQIRDGMKKTGTKVIGNYECRWPNDKYESFILMEYRDTQLLIDEIVNATKADRFRYLESETILGIAVPEE